MNITKDCGPGLHVSSLTNENQIFDCEIMDEETVKRLKSGKATGPDCL